MGMSGKKGHTVKLQDCHHISYMTKTAS